MVIKKDNDFKGFFGKKYIVLVYQSESVRSKQDSKLNTYADILDYKIALGK